MADKGLRNYSDEDLLEEMCRRQRVRLERDLRVDFRPCEDCVNFVFWTKGMDPPDTYNACRKGHKMSFRMPEHPHDEDSGFYRRYCFDREPRPAEQQPGDANGKD